MWLGVLVGQAALSVVSRRVRPGGVSFGPLIAHPDSPMGAVFAAARIASARALTTSIVGPTGVGKSELAKAMLEASGRGGRFVRVNCALLHKDMAWTELFGTRRGAFTGAVHRLGLVQHADRGMLFLDEIGDLDLAVQSDLLTFLDDRRFMPAGGVEVEVVRDPWVVCATNCDLRARVAAGMFRADLYYRVARFPIEIPPPSARPQDIPVLVDAHVAERSWAIDDDARDALVAMAQEHGNVRWLHDMIDASGEDGRITLGTLRMQRPLPPVVPRPDEGAALRGLVEIAGECVAELHEGRAMLAAFLGAGNGGKELLQPPEKVSGSVATPAVRSWSEVSGSATMPTAGASQEVSGLLDVSEQLRLDERIAVELVRAAGNRSRVACALGITRQTLYRAIDRLTRAGVSLPAARKGRPRGQSA